MLTIETTFFEGDSSGEVFVSLTVSVASTPFSGTGDCVLLGRDLDRFLDQFEPLARTSKGEALLVGGWGDSELVRLRFRPRGSLGPRNRSRSL